MATTWGRSSFPCRRESSLCYDRVEREDYEVFTLEDACLCDATSMEVFLEDWDSFSGQLRQAMENMAWTLRHHKNEEES